MVMVVEYICGGLCSVKMVWRGVCGVVWSSVVLCCNVAMLEFVAIERRGLQ